VTDAERIRRLELVVALLGLTAAVAAVVVMLDAIRFHAAALLLALSRLRFGDVHFEGIAMLALAGVSATAVGFAVYTAGRQVIAQRGFVRRLDCVATTMVDGREVVVVRGAGYAAFCAGLLRPRIYISQRTLERLSAEELRAVIAHEGHHADRLDPLRLLAGRALTSSLRVIPAVGGLGRRQAVLAELAADAAAVRSLGGPGPLASAFLVFDEDAAVAPERVDHLLGEATPDRFPPILLALAALALGALVTVALLLVVVPSHPEMPISSLPVCVLAVSIVASPAWLATRRVKRALRPRT